MQLVLCLVILAVLWFMEKKLTWVNKKSFLMNCIFVQAKQIKSQSMENSSSWDQTQSCSATDQVDQYLLDGNQVTWLYN